MTYIIIPEYDEINRFFEYLFINTDYIIVMILTIKMKPVFYCALEDAYVNTSFYYWLKIMCKYLVKTRVT